MVQSRYHNISRDVLGSSTHTTYCWRVSGCYREVEGILAEQRYVAGNVFTEADVRLFPTLVRFDEVYVVYFKTNKKCIREYPNISNYVRDVYQTEVGRSDRGLSVFFLVVLSNLLVNIWSTPKRRIIRHRENRRGRGCGVCFFCHRPEEVRHPRDETISASRCKYRACCFGEQWYRVMEGTLREGNEGQREYVAHQDALLHLAPRVERQRNRARGSRLGSRRASRPCQIHGLVKNKRNADESVWFHLLLLLSCPAPPLPFTHFFSIFCF